MGRLEGKVAVITGAGSGMGRDDSFWITGQTIVADGGLTVRIP